MSICGKDNLCLSIVKHENEEFHVMATELTDTFGYAVSSENCLFHSEEVVSNLLPEYGEWTGKDLEEVICKACKDIYKLLS